MIDLAWYEGNCLNYLRECSGKRKSREEEVSDVVVVGCLFVEP